jgi:subtilisin family serine protease
MREYIITVKDPASWDTGLWNELTVDGLGDNYIPTRSLEVLNERPLTENCANFNLSDEEAELIRQDDRILSVDYPISQRRGQIGHCSIRPAEYNRSTTTTTSNMKNWGLLRGISQSNNFGTNLNVVGNFNYSLDGTGVDIIVVDTGVEANHPEFAVNANGSGGTRVQTYDWNALATLYAIPDILTDAACGGYLGDNDGHGSNCASIAAGNTCGWAPGAHIFTMRILSGTVVPTKLPITNNVESIFELITAFHNRKKVLAGSGAVRPTICTNSWGRVIDYTGLQYTRYRNVQYNNVGAPNAASYGQVTSFQGPCPINYSDTNSIVDPCSAEGVIMVGAAGNSGYNARLPSVSLTDDYNNFWFDGTFSTFYHQGMFPTTASTMICVGAVDSMQSGSIERKVNFSNTGTRIDVYVPGVAIMGAYSNTAFNTPAVQDPRNPAYYLNKISGTSQACPQVTGLLACVLQARPTMTPAEAKKFIIENSTTGVLQITGAPGYTNFTDLQGGANRYLYQPFNNPIRGSINS